MADIEAQKSEVEERTRIQRKQEMDRLADRFEQTVGEIVQSVSAASVPQTTPAQLPSVSDPAWPASGAGVSEPATAAPSFRR